LGLLEASKWRRPARERMTLPVPVILNRLATDFFVLIPLGRLINYILSKRARTIESLRGHIKRYFKIFDGQKAVVGQNQGNYLGFAP
jgi:hypothetical protein